MNNCENFKVCQNFKEKKDWTGRNIIIRCITDLISLARKYEGFKFYVDSVHAQKEFGLVKLFTTRQCGKTEACFEMMRNDENICMVFKKLHDKRRWAKKNKDISDKFYTADNFGNPVCLELDDYKTVLVDSASCINEESMDKIIRTCSGIDDCICVLIG